jgi:hypothetical protein
MSELISTIGSLASTYAKPLTSLATAAGAGANLYTGIQNANNASGYNSTQSYIQNLVKNPQAMQKAAAAYTQPLTAGLTDSVTNQVQAQLAERGQGGSPSALTAALTQGLAPYIQQNQQTGLNTLMQSLGTASAARPQTLPSVNLSQLMALFKGGGSTGNPYQTIADANQNMAGSYQPTTPDLGDVDLSAAA